MLPGGAAVVGAVESGAVFDVVADDVHALALGVHGDRHSHAALEGRNFDLGPGLALVGGLEDLRRLGLWLSAVVAGPPRPPPVPCVAASITLGSS